ncbi:DUF2318 domain-containing protein [Geomonas sp. RF6]|uniref:DUF2318 domain-containing protein n=1 Tax=Geomonas sp. RF6 TaxID=2897342 RepID=UPI001E4FF24B|nr:DUF2318 domain-containing protein [Geomonas sp. RF6]UFS71122.1 DUF2318 domain-containing protein [Geomonas sp. RF6]
MKRTSNNLKWGGLTVGLLLVCATAFAFTLPGLGKHEKVQPVRGEVIIPVAKVSDGKAHFYSWSEKGKDLKFFIVKGTDGVLHTAFDACDVCFHEKKGYVQDGTAMTCKNCNKKFEITRIGAESGGGCNPSPLPARVDAKNVTVKVTDLRTGERFF